MSPISKHKRALGVRARLVHGRLARPGLFGAGLIRAAVVVGVGVALLSAVAPDPVRLARLAGRWQAVRAGADLHGQDGVTLQAGLHDCGPAALANLLARLGHPVPSLDSLAELSGTGPSGTRTSGLIRAAALEGVSLSRWSRPSVTADPGPEEIGGTEPFPVPSIAWVRRSHFVTVASRGADGRLLILDPLVGRYSISAADFRRIWSGEVLLVVQETPPVVATPVAALFPLAGGFHAKSRFGAAHVVPRRRLHHTSPRRPV